MRKGWHIVNMLHSKQSRSISPKKKIYGLGSGQYTLEGTVQRLTFENITRARNGKQEKELRKNILRLLGCTELNRGSKKS